ncbi:MAG: hypothetical protein V7637_6556 [Mycobacteriales bacterium]|jgi:hypothetical protein
MIWLTWRQFRTQALVVFGALVALAAVLASTGPGLAHRYADGVAACTTGGGDCSFFTEAFFISHRNTFVILALVVLFLPAVIGLFWGAPLVTRELETGTYRLVWSQTVSRDRWLAVKLGLVGLATAAAAGLASVAVSWWSSPLDKISGGQLPRMAPPIFETRGIVPIGYAAFALALGVTAGLLVRRTVPAMAIALAAFIAVQIAVPLWVRPHLMSPVRVVTPITAANIDGFDINNGLISVNVKPLDSEAWSLHSRTVDAAGHPVTSLPTEVTSVCTPPPPGPGGVTKVQRAPGFREACLAAISRAGYQQEQVYQPASRFWAFQWIETGLFGGLALGLAGFCFWRIRRLS